MIMNPLDVRLPTACFMCILNTNLYADSVKSIRKKNKEDMRAPHDTSQILQFSVPPCKSSIFSHDLRLLFGIWRPKKGRSFRNSKQNKSFAREPKRFSIPLEAIEQSCFSCVFRSFWISGSSFPGLTASTLSQSLPRMPLTLQGVRTPSLPSIQDNTD